MARRRYQKGSLALVGVNWVGRWREDERLPDGSIKRVRKACVLGDAKALTRRMAQRALDKHLEKVNDVSYRARSTCTLSQFIERWRKLALPQYRPSTQEVMHYHLKVNILPLLGNVKMESVTPEIVQAWVSSLKLAPSSISRMLTTLKAVWSVAADWGYVSKPLKGRIRIAKQPVKPRPVLTDEDARKLASSAKKPLSTIILLAFETGMRIGEILALDSSDFDSELGLLWVRRSVWKGRIQEPKTEAGKRVIAVSAPLVRGLAARKGLLFRTRTGKPYSQRNLLREFHKLLSRCGYPRMGFHAFRHGNASWMAKHGVPIKVAQERLGHADPRITLKIYSHVSAEDGRKMANQMASTWTQREEPESEVVDSIGRPGRI